MHHLNLSRCGLSVCVAALLVASCGGSQMPMGTAGGMPQSRTFRLDISRASVSPSTKSCPTAACIYVVNSAAKGSVTVYPSTASGNVLPYREITGLTNPTSIAVDPHGKAYVGFPECYVSNCIPAPTILVFSATAHGDARPLQTIFGRKTGLDHTAGIALDRKSDIYAINVHSNRQQYLDGTVTVYSPNANGDVAPIRRILGPNTGMRRSWPQEIAVDAGGNIYVIHIARRCHPSLSGPVCVGKGGVLVYAPGAHGDVAPSWTISGSNTGLSHPGGVAVDNAGNVYVANRSRARPFTSSVFVYASGEHGNVAPVQAISGSKTRLDGAVAVAVDAEHNIYVTNAGGPSVTVYGAGATGNVAPIQTIKGQKTGLGGSGIAVQ